jgi:oligopeptide/dipeptide ABC transporter ATP-binding protein
MMAALPAAGISADGDPLLEIRDLTVTFPMRRGGLRAVDAVSLSIAKGTTLGLVGESGCGKTMTALACLGLVPEPGRVTAGEVLFEGRDLTRLREDEMAPLRGNRIAMIFQEPMTSLNPVMAVGDQIAEVFRIHRALPKAQARAAAVEMLARVRIGDPARRARDYPHQLSGGMRQRAMIAMALACKPDVLIADEPTTALDVTIEAQVLDLILGLRDEMGMAILFISHNLAVVSEIADEVAVMYAGRIVERAKAAHLFARPAHPYTAGLIATLPRIGAHRRRLPVIAGAVPDPAALPRGCRFQDRCALADDVCRTVDPPLAPLSMDESGRDVACHKPLP